MVLLQSYIKQIVLFIIFCFWGAGIIWIFSGIICLVTTCHFEALVKKGHKVGRRNTIFNFVRTKANCFHHECMKKRRERWRNLLLLPPFEASLKPAARHGDFSPIVASHLPSSKIYNQPKCSWCGMPSSNLNSPNNKASHASTGKHFSNKRKCICSLAVFLADLEPTKWFSRIH